MPSQEQKIELARRIFPGFTFFGSQEPFHLDVQINARVDCVTITIESETKEFLNLGRITLIGPGGHKLDLVKTLRSAPLSTVYKEEQPQDVLPSVAEGKSIHSGFERRPRLTLDFMNATHIQSIRIGNRGDVWRKRSQNLVLHAWSGKKLVCHYLNNDDMRLLKMLEDILKSLQMPLPQLNSDDALLVDSFLSKKSQEIREAIVDKVCKNSLYMPLLEQCAIIPMDHKSGVTASCSQKMLGDIIARVFGQKGSLPTSRLRDFFQLMSTPIEIDLIRVKAEEALLRHTGVEKRLIFSKHTIAVGMSDLISRQTEYLSAMKQVQLKLEEMSITNMICYGTLLGAVRDGDLMKHDDDIDILILDDSTTREEMFENSEKLINDLRSDGYRVSRGGMNFHVTPPDHSVNIDVFPSWCSNSEYWLMMEKGKYRPVPTHHLLPVKSIEFLGVVCNVPKDPDAFLADRYGLGWKVADPYHEWCWPVSTASS